MIETAKRGRGRPAGDRTPDVKENRRYARVRAAVVLNEVLHLAACELLDGADDAAVAGQLVDRARALVPAEWFESSERTALETCLRRVAVDRREVRRLGPQKWAAARTGPMLGHGTGWYRDAVERSPWAPARRRRYSPAAPMRTDWRRATPGSKEERRPSRFDRFSRVERLWLRLPAAARHAVESAVRHALAGGLGSAVVVELVAFFNSSADDRDLIASSPAFAKSTLGAVVREAIGELPAALRTHVRALCRRPTGHGGTRLEIPVPALGRPRRPDRTRSGR